MSRGLPVSTVTVAKRSGSNDGQSRRQGNCEQSWSISRIIAGIGLLRGGDRPRGLFADHAKCAFRTPPPNFLIMLAP